MLVTLILLFKAFKKDNVQGKKSVFCLFLSKSDSLKYFITFFIHFRECIKIFQVHHRYVCVVALITSFTQ